jgi:hypothetical protein
MSRRKLAPVDGPEGTTGGKTASEAPGKQFQPPAQSPVLPAVAPELEGPDKNQRLGSEARENSTQKTNSIKERSDMKPKQSKSHRAPLLVGACALLMILSIVPAGFAQQAAQAQPRPNQQVAPAPSAAAANAATVDTAPGTQAATRKPAAEPAAPAKAAETAKPGSDGIKIHGHWVLEVKNPDGKLVERREFDNSLVTGAPGPGGAPWPTGSQLLTALLSGNATAGDPAIVFVSPLESYLIPMDVCAGGEENYAQCDYFTTGSSSFFSPSVCDISSEPCTTESGLGLTANFQPVVSWVLSGYYVVKPNGSKSIGAVMTMMAWCHSPTLSMDAGIPQGSMTDRKADIGSKSCDPNHISGTGDSYNFASLTYTNIPGGPLKVSENQVIAVTVTISFS